MIKKLRITVDGEKYDVTVELPEAPVRSPVNSVSNNVSVSSAHISPSTTLRKKNPTTIHLQQAADPGDVPSPLAGRITAVNVKVGQAVNEGDHLITLEAMKMNTFVVAPHAGKIKEIKVTVGTAVEEGQALISLA